MRLLQICSRKQVLLFLAVITLLSIFWTYWIGSRLLQDDTTIPKEGYESLRNKIRYSDEDVIFQVQGRISKNEVSAATEREISLRPNNSPYFVTRRSNIALEIFHEDGKLLQRLRELEKKYQTSPEIFLANLFNSSQEEYVKTLTDALNVLGYKVVFLKDSTEIQSLPSSLGSLWCVRRHTRKSNTSHCFPKDYVDLQEFKVSPIPGLEKHLLRNDGFCYLMSASSQISALQKKSKYPYSHCYVLPAQLNKFLQDFKLKSTQLFTLKSLGPEATPLDKWGSFHSFHSKIEGPLKAVIQVYPEDAIKIEGRAVLVQVYVLVTSASPLRVYRYREEGHVLLQSNQQNTFKKWTLEKFLRHLENYFGKDKANQAIERMDELLVTMLLLLEPSLLIYVTNLTAGKQSFRCKRCFQPLEVSFLFTSTLEPVILEVKDVAFGEISPRTIRDTVNVLFNLSSSHALSQETYQTLQLLKQKQILKNSQCNQSKKKCLTDDFLEYLLQTKQEELHIGNFKRLYPTVDGLKYKALMSELVDTGVDLHNRHTSTPDVHDILTFFVTQTSTKTWSQQEGVSLSDRRLENPGVPKGSLEEDDCNDEPDVVPVLREFYTRPSVLLQPQFSSDLLSYQATVSFDTMVLKIWGKSSTCQSDIRVNTKHDNSKSANHSLGVGWNKFSIFVIDTRHPSPSIVTTYSVFVFRKRRSEMERAFNGDSTHQVCTHHQECSLKVFPDKPCGLEKLSETTWKTFLLKQNELSFCETSHEPGRWVLPCESCDDSNSCYWREAVWAPNTCQYSTLTRDETRSCLAGKKILFVGDSTNRGIMYYLMEKLNGSLRKWEKTHTMKIYSDELNGRRTSVSFAYYPQFWLAENKRPVFVKALYQLIARFLPLENNTNTVLVVGGVQWMGAHHITETNKALTSLGLNGIKVIVKSLGSGFHLPVPGLPRYDLTGQRRTAERNQEVIDSAKKLGYQAVDTFSMTVSRYKDFLLGNCGCHFHKVVDMRSLVKEEDEVPSPLLENLDSGNSEGDLLPRYHVIGPINSVYSELVIKGMCS
ncbi:unnamed protein product [Porites lobata]|uniref:Cadherin-like and PC-esterase domain-containing protein 1 n=1 Tax=Porites lobata TaxID=104759 RepID=A0ABN8MWN8_9CNID|nr:unnamed protein product [Porites lobata]